MTSAVNAVVTGRARAPPRGGVSLPYYFGDWRGQFLFGLSVIKRGGGRLATKQKTLEARM